MQRLRATFRDNNGASADSVIKVTGDLSADAPLAFAAAVSALSDAVLIEAASTYREPYSDSAPANNSNVRLVALFVGRSVATPANYISTVIPSANLCVRLTDRTWFDVVDLTSTELSNILDIWYTVTGDEYEFLVGGIWR